MHRTLVVAILCGIALTACSQPSGQPAPTDPPAPERWAKIKRQIRAEFPAERHVSTAEVERLLEQGKSTVIDVRHPAEFAVSHLAGAKNMQEHELVAALKDHPRDQPVLLYCSVGYRSARAARSLREAGFTDVRNYLGSIFAWANAGQPMVDAAGATHEAHPYDADWGQLLRRPLHRSQPRR